MYKIDFFNKNQNDIVGMSALTITEYPVVTTAQNYFCNNLTEHQLIDILSYCGAWFNNLRCCSNELKKRVDEITSYFMQANHNGLRPIDTTNLTNTFILTNHLLFKHWGKSKSTFQRELLFGEACRTGDISTVKHIMSVGVDIDGNLLRKKSQEHGSQRPVQDAVSFNQPETLKFLFKYGASMEVDVSSTYFLDNGWTDLYDFVTPPLLNNNNTVPNHVTHQILSLITKEYMIRKDYSIFFRPGWRSNELLFPWFCTALAAIPKKTKSGHGSHCQNNFCGQWCNDVLICNGKMLCPVCANKPVREKLTLENCSRLLWIPPPVVINEGMFDEWDDADQSIGSIDYAYEDDQMNMGEYDIEDDTSVDWDYNTSDIHQGDDALETEAYGY